MLEDNALAIHPNQGDGWPQNIRREIPVHWHSIRNLSFQMFPQRLKTSDDRLGLHRHGLAGALAVISWPRRAGGALGRLPAFCRHADAHLVAAAAQWALWLGIAAPKWFLAAGGIAPELAGRCHVVNAASSR